MIDPANPRPCPNCKSSNTRISDFDPPFSATLTCDACEHDSTLDEDGEPIDIEQRYTALLASIEANVDRISQRLGVPTSP